MLKMRLNHFVYVVYNENISVSRVDDETKTIKISKQTFRDEFNIPYSGTTIKEVKVTFDESLGRYFSEDSEVIVLPYDKSTYESLKVIFKNLHIEEPWDAHRSVLAARDKLLNLDGRNQVSIKIRNDFTLDLEYKDQNLGTVIISDCGVGIQFLYRGEFHSFDDLLSAIQKRIDFLDNEYNRIMNDFGNHLIKVDSGFIITDYLNNYVDFWDGHNIPRSAYGEIRDKIKIDFDDITKIIYLYSSLINIKFGQFVQGTSIDHFERGFEVSCNSETPTKIRVSYENNALNFECDGMKFADFEKFMKFAEKAVFLKSNDK